MRSFLAITVLASLILLTSPAFAGPKADTKFPETLKALEGQGFVYRDEGDYLLPGEMPLNDFWESDELNSGSIFGPLEHFVSSAGPKPFQSTSDRIDTRNMGFESDRDHYTPIVKEIDH